MEYRVLARKYRPARFEDLIGQDVLVRTLTNAIKTDRLAHAYLLTGIRGIGKTTTARIIARALNCIGPDGTGIGPATSPCGVCSHCTMIAEDRHVDVLEMDAASRTGVNDIRDIIETVRYLPSSARYKVYIIDEVHMLSSSAFNALLKTLEEPPPHVKFIFATTEVRKIPVTILSRCQRFDLKRVEVEKLTNHLKDIAAREMIAAQDEALRLIAVASEGSVRDSLSMLDQAAALCLGEGDNNVTSLTVRGMLGLADKSRSFRLLAPLLEGNAAGALEEWTELHRSGADSLMALQDLLELVHLLTRLKLSPDYFKLSDLPEEERVQGQSLAAKLSLPVLARLWQMLLKGVQEVRFAPDPATAAEMVLIRVAYASALPFPEEAVRAVATEPAAAPRTTTAPAAPVTPRTTPSYPAHGNLAVAAPSERLRESQSEPENKHRAHLSLVEPKPAAEIGTFEELVALFEQHHEIVLHSYLAHHVRLVRMAEGTLVLNPTMNLPADFSRRISQCLSEWTGNTWNVMLSKEAGAPSIAENEAQQKQQAISAVKQDPLVKNILEHFPDATLTSIKE